VEDSQFLCAGSCKSCKDEETWPVHWKHLAWSFTALARGIHPCEDADGNSWPIGSYRASVAGTPLCPNSGFRAVIWVLAGDMDYLQVDLGLPHQASLDPCAWCKCNKSDTPFNDFRENAKWKTVRRSPADHIADPVTNHLIMTIPGVNFFCFHLDSLHVLDLGVTSHAIGNLLWEICVDHLPGNRAVALATLNKQIAEIYIELNVPKSKWIPALTYKHFNATASTYPNLKHMKGRRIRQFVPVALKLAQEFCADDEHTQHRLEVFKSLDTLYNCIDSPGLEFSSETQQLFSTAVDNMLAHYGRLAKLSYKKNLYRWSIVPKFHYLAHFPEQSKFLAPRVSWTYGSESFMGTVAALCQACLSGTPSFAVSLTLMLKYRMGSHLRLCGLVVTEDDF
jgi:hypothetical protein